MVRRSNPLEDTRSTIDIEYVVQQGVLHEADTLDEVWPETRPFGPYCWVEDAQTARRPACGRRGSRVTVVKTVPRRLARRDNVTTTRCTWPRIRR